MSKKEKFARMERLKFIAFEWQKIYEDDTIEIFDVISDGERIGVVSHPKHIRFIWIARDLNGVHVDGYFRSREAASDRLLQLKKRRENRMGKLIVQTAIALVLLAGFSIFVPIVVGKVWDVLQPSQFENGK